MVDGPALSERFELRFSKEMLEKIDRWRGREPSPPPRAEAIRRLIENGLKATNAET